MRLSTGVFSAVVVLVAAAVPALADHDPPPAKFIKPITGYRHVAKPNYSYDYGIKDKYSGVKLDVKEQRKGDRTDGEYTSLLPDGRIQRVTYFVDGKSGFVANVHYEGVAKHPLPKKKHVKSTKFVSFRPHKPLPYVPDPVEDIHHGYGGDDDDDSYASYGQGFSKKASFKGHDQHDFYSGQQHVQHDFHPGQQHVQHDFHPGQQHVQHDFHPGQQHVQHDFFPGQQHVQHRPDFKSYDQGQFNNGAHRLFQQQYPH